VPEATETAAEKSFKSFSEPERNVLVPNRPHAYFENVHRVIALSDFSRQPWTVKVPYQGFVLALAHDESSGEGTFWTRPLGNGRIIISGFGSLFTNRALGLGENAQLLANIVGANVGEKGTVLFDDAHQGVGATYDPDKFFKDRRLYLTAGVLAALWLIWVLGSTRLRLPPTYEPVPREAELIRAAGGFLSRALPDAAGAQQMIENFLKRVTSRAGMQWSTVDSDARGAKWGLLQRNSRIASADIVQLQRWYEASRAGKRVPLRSLHNLILRLDRQMAT
jgi:hypothetical protein